MSCGNEMKMKKMIVAVNAIYASLRNCINCVHCDDHFFIVTHNLVII